MADDDLRFAVAVAALFVIAFVLQELNRLLDVAAPFVRRKLQRLRQLARVDQVEQECMDLAEAYPGCMQLMDKLHEDHCVVAVCSNAPAHYIDKVLEKIQLADRIDYKQPLEPQMQSKSESLRALLDRVQPEQGAVMVGDTSMDRIAADDNNLPFIGCLYGYRPEEMQNEPYQVSRPDEIADLVHQILG